MTPGITKSSSLEMASRRRSSRHAAWPRRSSAGTDAALHRWWRARDVEALPYFFLGQDEGALGPPMELQQVVFSHVAKTPALRARMAATMEHQLSPTDTFPVRQVLWWTLGAALRGSLGVVPQFLAMGRRGLLSTASCVCADGFSLRQRTARYELHRQR